MGNEPSKKGCQGRHPAAPALNKEPPWKLFPLGLHDYSYVLSVSEGYLTFSIASFIRSTECPPEYRP